MTFANVVEHMASALAFARCEPDSQLASLRMFDCAQPVTSAYVREVAGKQDENRGGMFSDVTPGALGEPVRYALMSDVVDDDKWRGYLCVALRELAFREMRGIALPFASPSHCRLFVAEVTPKGTFIGAERFCSWHRAERQWLTWKPHVQRVAADAFSARAQLVLGAQFTARYEWHVRLALPGAPRLSLPCSAEEARVLFKARDLPPGKERRAALRHWVSEHFRNDGEVAVRAHLRGATDFTWESMQCAIVPARA